MIDALGSVGSLLLVGGTSDIAVATARAYLAERPLRVVVAARETPRRSAVAEELRAAGATVDVVDFDADDPASPARMVEEAFAGGDVDVALVAFEISRRHRFAADMAALPPSVVAHVLPTGDEAPQGMAQLRYRDASKVGVRVERAHAATAAYLAGLP